MQYIILNTYHSWALIDLIVKVCKCSTPFFSMGFNHLQQPATSPTKVLSQQLPPPYNPHIYIYIYISQIWRGIKLHRYNILVKLYRLITFNEYKFYKIYRWIESLYDIDHYVLLISFWDSLRLTVFKKMHKPLILMGCDIISNDFRFLQNWTWIIYMI
jgi:hypothetical protein